MKLIQKYLFFRLLDWSLSAIFLSSVYELFSMHSFIQLNMKILQSIRSLSNQLRS